MDTSITFVIIILRSYFFEWHSVLRANMTSVRCRRVCDELVLGSEGCGFDFHPSICFTISAPQPSTVSRPQNRLWTCILYFYVLHSFWCICTCTGYCDLMFSLVCLVLSLVVRQIMPRLLICLIWMKSSTKSLHSASTAALVIIIIHFICTASFIQEM